MIKIEGPIGQTDVVLLIPNDIAPKDGDERDGLRSFLRGVVLAMASEGWEPLDFGEEHAKHTELWFIYNPKCALINAHEFIKNGGWVS